MFNQILLLNQKLLTYFNSFATNHIVKTIVIIFADLPIFFLPLFLVGYWFYYNKIGDKDKKEQLLYIFYSTVVSIILNIIIQKFIYIQRPLAFLGAKAHFILSHIPDASFPSDHASVGFAFLGALYLSGYKKIFWYFLPVVLIMLLSRVIAGVHWPLDILAGVIIGIVSAYIIFFLKDNKLIKTMNSFILKLTSFIKL